MTETPDEGPDDGSDNNGQDTRRSFLRGAALIGAATTAVGIAATIMRSPEHAANRGAEGANEGPAAGTAGTVRKLTMVTTWPKNFPGVGTGAERLAKRIETLTEGRLTVKVYAAGERVAALGAFDAVAQGKADFYHGAEYYWQGKSKAFNFFASVPFGMTATEHKSWIHFGGGQQLWDRLGARFNIKPFMGGNTGLQMGGWFNREIKTIDDFKGLRIRMPGLGGEVMRRVGASPVTLAGGDIFMALDQGTIDASEWVGPWNDVAFGFHRIAKYYYSPGIHEPGTCLGMGVNLGVWNSLSDLDRQLIEHAALAEDEMMHAEYEHQNALSLDRIRAEGKVVLRHFSDEILAELGTVSYEVLAEIAADDPFTGEVYESYMAHLRRAARWGNAAEHAYTRARTLSLTEGA